MSPDLSDDDLRRLLAARASALDPDPVDGPRVVRRTRVRRTGAILGASALGLVLVGGLGVGTVAGLSALSANRDSADVGAADAGTLASPEAGNELALAAIDRVDLCASTPAAFDTPTIGLTMTVDVPAEVPAGTPTIAATVTLSNTTATTITGSASPGPALSIVQDDLVVWHSSGMEPGLAPLSIAAGDAVTFVTDLRLQRCTAEDDLGEVLPTDLPALEPGVYSVSALMQVTPDGDGALTALIRSQPATLTIVD